MDVKIHLHHVFSKHTSKIIFASIQLFIDINHPMISIKSKSEIEKMRKAGKLAAELLQMIEIHVKEGVSTQELNDIVHNYTIERGAISAPLNYHGFPKSICTSINNVVCHGIPNPNQILKNGDIVNIDVTVIIEGFHGDSSRTFIIGNVSDAIKDLVSRTYHSMHEGIKVVRPNAFFGEIGAAIEKYIKPFGYGIVRDFCGHGIGQKFHEDPIVLHYKSRDKGKRMKAGMTFTIEPMINLGSWETYTDALDGWTAYTKDGSISAQFEHTVLVTDNGYEILTQLDS
jgi:methionyl aminopeptidase